MSIRKFLKSYEKYSNLSDFDSIFMLLDETEVMEVMERLPVLLLLEIDEYVLSRLYLNFSKR